MFSKLAAAAVAATGAHALTTSEPELVHPWTTDLSQASSNANMDVSIALTRPQHKLDELAVFVSEVSDPQHPSYGQYMTGAEVREMIRPHDSSRDAVLDWLRDNGIAATVHESGFKIDFHAPISKIEELFETRVRNVVSTESHKSVLRAGDVTFPGHLDNHIQAVFGLHGLPIPQRELRTMDANDEPPTMIPTNIEKKYNVAGVNVTRGLKNRQAVAEFQGQDVSTSDIKDFFHKYVPDYQEGDDKIYKVVGSNSEYSGTEAALDAEYIMGLAPGIKTEFWGYPGQDFCRDLSEFTVKILSTDDVPNVFSISYGWQGKLSDIGCNVGDSTHTNDNLKAIAARGVSVLVSSGDSGAQLTYRTVYPSWPASSPYVTAVGGTRFINQEVDNDEMATDQFGSGGGFSSDFDRTEAQWQEKYVTDYLKTVQSYRHTPPMSAYDRSGRGTPDVSAIAEGYAVITNGYEAAVGGTSASAPMVAALVSLLNEARLARGKPQLGLLNQFIYQNPSAWKSVNAGTNAIGRDGYSFKYGWDCVQGWDAATGLGTPLFDKLLDLALTL